MAALGETFQLRPHNRTVDAAGERALRESAICAGHHAVTADDVGIAQQPLGHELGMLDDVGRMCDEPRHQHLACGQRHVLPHLPFVLVARIGRLETISADIDPQHEIDDVLDRHVEHVRSVPAAPADVVARAILRQPPKRVVERIDAQARPVAVIRERHRWHHLFVLIRDERVVDLQVEAGIDDGAIFGPERFGEAEQERLLIAVVLVFGAGRYPDAHRILRSHCGRPLPSSATAAHAPKQPKLTTEILKGSRHGAWGPSPQAALSVAAIGRILSKERARLVGHLNLSIRMGEALCDFRDWGFRCQSCLSDRSDHWGVADGL